MPISGDLRFHYVNSCFSIIISGSVLHVTNYSAGVSLTNQGRQIFSTKVVNNFV